MQTLFRHRQQFLSGEKLIAVKKPVRLRYSLSQIILHSVALAMTQNNRSRYLMVKHSEGWNVDRCKLWMDKNRYSYDWCYPASGQAFPSPDEYSGVIVFGGAGSANDCQEKSWVRDEMAFVEACLKYNTPFFGICLGAQILARVLGSKVSAHPHQHNEIGFHEVFPTAAGAGFLSQPLKFMQWHREGFELPSGAIHLAHNELFPNQAFKTDDRTVGVQFHPEVNLDVLRIWHERNKTRPKKDVLDDATRERHIADAIACEDSITAWLDQFLTTWTRLAAQAA